MKNIRIELQERDLAILLYLYNARIASNTEMALIFFNNNTMLSSKRLSQLVATGYVLSSPYSFGSKRYAGKHYRLTQQGLDEITNRGFLSHLPPRAARIISSDTAIITALKLGEVRSSLIESGIIALKDWQFPRDVRETYKLPRFTPVCCCIRDIMVLYVFGGAFKFLVNTIETTNRLTTTAVNGHPQINHVIIVYEAEKERTRLLAQYVSGSVYMSTFAQLPILITDLLTGKPTYHMNELISRYKTLHPCATFASPLYGLIEAMPNGLAYEPTALLIDGITGSIFARQQFLAAQKERRIALVRQGTDLLLSSDLPATPSAGKVLRATGKLA